MNTFAASRTCAPIVAALAMSAFALVLMGCSDTPHDRVDNTARGAPAPPTVAETKPAPSRPAASSSPAPTEAEMGIPIYPNAKIYTDAAGMAVRPLMDASMATAMLETTDSLGKVLAFYKERIKQADARGNATPVTPRDETENGKRRTILTGNDASGNVQIIQLHEESGKTVIELTRAIVKITPTSVSGDPSGTPDSPTESGGGTGASGTITPGSSGTADTPRPVSSGMSSMPAPGATTSPGGSSVPGNTPFSSPSHSSPNTSNRQQK